ncbi:MAG TPA: hypothetical protein VKL21_11155 [Candidatus Methanoperedens sp.]|nr:hypothetical protein [Candidatus Methanoperedens sp.]
MKSRHLEKTICKAISRVGDDSIANGSAHLASQNRSPYSGHRAIGTPEEASISFDLY